MLKYALMFLIGCSTDVSISKTYETDPSDTSVNKDTTVVENDDTQTQETQDEDTNTEQDLSKTVAYVEMGLMQASCPYCMGLSQEINTTAKVRLHQPTTAEHTSWLPQQDGCRDYYESNVSTQNIDVGSSVMLENTMGDNFQLNRSQDASGVIYENSYISDFNFRRNTAHTLSVNGSTAENVLETLRGFDFIEPYTMLYVDPSYAFQAPVNRYGDNTFTWGPSGDQNSFFTIHISVFSNDGSMYYGTVICRSNDVGYMAIPGSYFQQYQNGNIVSIHLMRHRVFKNQYEDFGGTIEGYSWWEVIGTGYIQ